MYYQNGSYVQDFNYYNQTPNYGYNPYIANNYQNMNGQMQMPTQNLNAMYPAVYRIISPVASQVLSNCNTGYLTDENLNNMVDTIYNIVEKDINMRANSTSANSNVSNENSNVTNCDKSSPRSTSSSVSNTANESNRQNSLLRDLIKIILLNDIIARRQNNNLQMMQQNNRNQSMFMQ